MIALSHKPQRIAWAIKIHSQKKVCNEVTYVTAEYKPEEVATLINA